MNPGPSSTAASNAAAKRAAQARWLVATLMLLAPAACLHRLLLAEHDQRLLWRAARELSRQHFGEAEALARAVVAERPECAAAWLVAGQAAAQNQRLSQALEYLQRVPDSQPAEYVHAQYWSATRLLVLGRAAEAERALRNVVALDPHHRQANDKLAELLQIEGRTWEALPHAQRVLSSGWCGRSQLLMIGGVDSMMVHDPHFVETCLLSVPSDSLVLLGAARLALIDNRMDEAEKVLRRIVQDDRDQVEAQARLGELLLQKSDTATFLAWHTALPAHADSHPLVWYVRGLWAKQNGQPRAAVRAFLEALRRNPNHASSSFQLSQVLVALGSPETAEAFAERARLLSKLEFLLHELRALTDLRMMQQVVEIQQQTGRWWEAAGWCYAALAVDPKAAWAKRNVAQPLHAMAAMAGFTDANHQPALGLELKAWPLPVLPRAAVAGVAEAARGPIDGEVRLVDVAAETGLDFRYYNGTESHSGLGHILETTGGGVGVLDYDADGWPDLYFAQSGPWQERGEQAKFRDRLFRNRGDGHFEDVTEQAGLGDGEFSQGLAVGDYNSDGFPDLYLANVGHNRLYENHGDGTFRDVTSVADVAGEDWSSSCAVVDLNGDALPDIYVVNYLLLDEVLERHCDQQGHPMGCSPTMFTAAQDRMYLNLGDGRFRDITEQSGIRVADGKGLGVVAADLDSSGTMDLFVGNDTTANFYFVNQTNAPGQHPEFVEQGILSGLAFNEAGQAQACMGIALGDANGDGLTDLFIGNFYSDSNTLYLQNHEHLFVDDTRRAQLREPSFFLLTFGTQFIDADADGWQDLLLSNGHVDRPLDPNIPALMPPQYFRNRSGGTFDELSSRSLGSYFQRQYLGRSVALLDWDRDGREDACISHLDAPAALLANRTKRTGHYLAIKLHGVTSARDAFGATLELTAGGRTWKRHLAAGNGYMASNERRTLFGIGAAQRVDRLRILWPAGGEQILNGLDVDQEITIVEGRDVLLPGQSGAAAELGGH